MMNFNEVSETVKARLNRDSCQCHFSGDTISVFETKDDGKANIDVTVTRPCIHIKCTDKYHFPLLSQKKCADHLLLLYDEGTKTWDIHIFELTRKIKKNKWEEKIIPQSEGALGDAIAIIGIVCMGEYHQVYLHCGYRVNADEASPVKLHPTLGMSAKNTDDWLNQNIILEKYSDIEIINRPIRLDEETGHATYKV